MTGQVDGNTAVRVVYGALRRLDRCSNTAAAFRYAAAAEGVTLDVVGPVIDDAMRSVAGKDRADLPGLSFEHQRMILRATGGHLLRAIARPVGAL